MPGDCSAAGWDYDPEKPPVVCQTCAALVYDSEAAREVHGVLHQQGPRLWFVFWPPGRGHRGPFLDEARAREFARNTDGLLYSMKATLEWQRRMRPIAEGEIAP